jgi:hypothetical protein
MGNIESPLNKYDEEIHKLVEEKGEIAEEMPKQEGGSTVDALLYRQQSIDSKIAALKAEKEEIMKLIEKENKVAH